MLQANQTNKYESLKNLIGRGMNILRGDSFDIPVNYNANDVTRHCMTIVFGLRIQFHKEYLVGAVAVLTRGRV